MDRRSIREIAFKMLFEADFKEESDRDEIFLCACEEAGIKNDDYLKSVFYGVLENKEKLDSDIAANARGWKLSRISKVSLTAMRMSVYEMLFLCDIPFAVSINEALEIVKKYDEDGAAKFVNGILNSVAASAGLKDSKK